MRALITGISGFVGSHLAEYLLTHTEWEIAGTVYGRLDNIEHLRGRLALHEAELGSLDVVRAIVEQERPDYIFHLAAQPIPTLSHRNPWFTLENNIQAQLNVLEAVYQLGLPARVLVVGSSEEYGQVAEADLPIDENAPLRPTTPYAVSKIAQDYLGLQYYLAHGVESVRVRPFNHIGPRQRLGFVAPDFACQIARIEAGHLPPEVHVGSLDAERDFSDVRDIVAGYTLALTRGQPGEAYNLGSGRAWPVRMLLDMLIELAGAGGKITVVQDPERVRAGVAPRIVADCRKLHEATGWQPEIPLERSLADVLAYWREQVRTGATDPTPAQLRP